MATRKKNKTGLNKALLYKIRYNLLREAGFSPSEARKMRTWGSKRGVNIDFVKYDKRTGKIKYNREYYNEVNKLKNVRISKTMLQSFLDNANSIDNDTIYTHWGLLTHDERYRDNTSKLASQLQKTYGWNNDQSYYFIYNAFENGLDFDSNYKELTSSEGFEMYKKNKVNRTESNRRYRKRNPERIREINKRYRERNPERIKESARRSRENKKQKQLEALELMKKSIEKAKLNNK